MITVMLYLNVFLHHYTKGIVTVSEYGCVDKIHFSSWYQAMCWICKQAKRVSEYEVQGPEYIVDSGHYRYRVYFPKNQE